MKGYVLTVTLNPMIDKTVQVASLSRGGITRATSASAVVGGKGINVSRQLRRLGTPTLAITFAAGETGEFMKRLLREEGIPFEMIEVEGMTREGVTYREEDGTMTSVFEPQHPVAAVESRRLLDMVRGCISSAAWVVCSGGAPSPAADAVFADIVRACRTADVPVAVDSYGMALKLAIEAGPALIKPNRQEYESTFGVELEDTDDMLNAARECVRKGVGSCFISDGAGPGVAVSAGEEFIVNPPEIAAVNPTGSGDTLVAGLVYGMQQGWSFSETVKFGTAAASANAEVWEVASVPPGRIAEMSGRVSLTKLVPG
jgi:1-phosphofructokinase family hexose kinase